MYQHIPHRALRIPRFLLWLLLPLSLAACNGEGSSSSTPPFLGYTVSGTISVSNNTVVDGDVNDEHMPYRANDGMGSAQAIPNPVILGGYVNQPGYGEPGRSYASGDDQDYYQADLSAGQAVNLFIGASDAYFNDLDLYLVNRNGEVVASSESRGDTEGLRVPASGRYFIVVQAYRGASNYLLSVGQTAATQSAKGMRLEDDFAPGQVIVRFKPEIKQSLAIMRSLSADLGIEAVAGEPDRRMLFEIGEEGRLSAQSAGQWRFAEPELARKHQTLQAVKALYQRPEVLDASPNYLFHAKRVPSDNLYRYQWHYSMINLPQAWDITTGSSNVIVAVVDTGILHNHPDLRGKTVAGYDFIKDRTISLDGDGIDNNPEDPGDNSSSGSTFHGTHVAGTIGALSNNNEGVAGIGWNTLIMPMRVLGKGGSGYDYDIEQAIRFAAGLPNDSRTVPAKAADVINMSLGGESISAGFQDLVNQVRGRGIFFVAASGNDGQSLINYPAALNGVISVAAVDINRKRAFYSNYHSTVDITAPGGDVNTDVNGDGVNDGIVSTLGDDTQGGIRYIYSPSMGTSMATPHVAGIVALMKAANPRLTPQDFDNLLSSGRITEDLGSPGRDNYYGHGLIDAYKAVVAAAELGGGGSVPSVPAQLAVTPGTLNFGLDIASQTLTVNNAGGGSLSLSRVTRTADFVSVTPNAVDSRGLGTYTVTVNRSLLSAGTYTATLNFISTANTVSVDLIMQVGDPRLTGDGGRQYVLLVKPEDPTGDPIKQVAVSAVNGRYGYTFSGVPAGQYTVVSGSDLNQDMYICDAGESCGAYLTIEKPSTLTVERNLSGVDFSIGFTTQFLSKGMQAADGKPEDASRQGFRRLDEDGGERKIAR